MSDTDRVHTGRKKLRHDGLVSMTIWVKAETKDRYEDLALTHRCSVSALAQQALDTYRPEAVAVTAPATETAQLHALIQAERAQMTREVTAAVTATVTETLLAKLPALVQATVSSPVSATAMATGTATATHYVPRGQRKLTPRQAAALRAKRHRGVPIKALMQEYGLSKASVFRYLKTPAASRPRQHTRGAAQEGIAL